MIASQCCAMVGFVARLYLLQNVLDVRPGRACFPVRVSVGMPWEGVLVSINLGRAGFSADCPSGGVFVFVGMPSRWAGVVALLSHD